MINILIIDDEELFGISLEQELNDSSDFTATYVSSPKHALELNKQDFHIIFLDLRLQNTSGLNHIETLKSKWATSKLYIMTGYGTIATAISAIKLGATDYLTKPITLEKIKALISSKIVIDDDRGQDTVMSLDRNEREYIEHVLAQENGNITKAAEKLGLHRQSLQRKLKKWVPKK